VNAQTALCHVPNIKPDAGSDVNNNKALRRRRKKKLARRREINALRSRDATRKQNGKAEGEREEKCTRVEMYKKMRIKLEPAKQKPISCERKIEREASRKEFFCCVERCRKESEVMNVKMNVIAVVVLLVSVKCSPIDFLFQLTDDGERMLMKRLAEFLSNDYGDDSSSSSSAATSNGIQTRGVSARQENCRLPMKRGLCRALLPRWR
jgi:hypothetical protein